MSSGGGGAREEVGEGMRVVFSAFSLDGLVIDLIEKEVSRGGEGLDEIVMVLISLCWSCFKRGLDRTSISSSVCSLGAVELVGRRGWAVSIGSMTESVCVTGAVTESVCVTGVVTESVCVTGAVTESVCVTGVVTESVCVTGVVTESVCVTGAVTESVCVTGVVTESVCVTGGGVVTDWAEI